MSAGERPDIEGVPAIFLDEPPAVQLTSPSPYTTDSLSIYAPLNHLATCHMPTNSDKVYFLHGTFCQRMLESLATVSKCDKQMLAPAFLVTKCSLPTPIRRNPHMD